MGSDIDVVILLAGLYLRDQMADAGETAILSFVNNGGGFVSTEWLNWNYDHHHLNDDLIDLLLLEEGNGYDDGAVNITLSNSGQPNHPIVHELTGVIAAGSISYEASFQHGVERAADITCLLDDDNNNPVLLARDVGSGRAFNFNQGVGYYAYAMGGGNDVFDSSDALKMWELTAWYAGGDDDFDGYNEADGDCDDNDDQVVDYTWYLDSDGDGLGDSSQAVSSNYSGSCTAPTGYVEDGTDCNDADATILGPTDWFADTDGDGLGDPSASTSSCTGPTGYVSNDSDCYDADAATGAALTWYDDCDDDGYGVDSSWEDGMMCTGCGSCYDMDGDGNDDYCEDIWESWWIDTTLTSCDEPANQQTYGGCGDWASNADDCDDNDAAVYPGVQYADADGDGYGDASASSTQCGSSNGYVADATDCDDTDANTNPGVTEEGCSGDYDCDGLVGVDDPDFLDWYLGYYCLDLDGDGSPSNVGCVTTCAAPSALYVHVCSPYGPDPFHGGDCYSGDPTMPYEWIYGPRWDCDDNDASVFEGAPELCDGLLNDCYVDNGVNDVSSNCDTSECEDMCDPSDLACQEQCSSGSQACWEAFTGLADSESDLDGDGAVDCVIDSGGWDGDASVTQGEDCDDTDASFIESSWYTDLDGDGYGDASSITTSCSQSLSSADSGSVTPGQPIPDNDIGGVDSVLSMAGCDGLQSVEVTVDITHTWIGDLTVELASPDGTWVTLHNATGGSANDISGTYADGGPDLTPYEALANFVGEQSAGDWMLNVSDDTAPDTGTLNSWGLSFTCGGYADNGDDCDDSDAAITVEQTYYSDLDGDGYGDPATGQSACTAPGNAVSDATDCDDSDGTAYPGAVEDLTDGIDQDCDGIAQLDADGDGHLSEATDGDDCDDSDASVYPGAVEDLTDAIDSDCDGYAELDLDGDGVISNATGGEDCNDYDASVAILSWHYDGDQDTYGTSDPASTHCEWVMETTWVCDGAQDMCMQSCGGDPTCESECPEDSCWEEGYEMEYCGYPNVLEACTQPAATQDYYGTVHSYVPNDLDCDDSDQETNPDQEEVCGDGIDNNCDGYTDNLAIDMVTWNIDYDDDGYGSAAYTMEACAQPTGWVADGTDCDDMSALNYPGADEYCDTVDNNCDGEIDEASAVDALEWYADTDEDGFGDAANTSPACEQPTGYLEDATDCDDTDAGVGGPTAWYPDNDGDGFGDMAAEVLECVAPAGYIAQTGDCDDDNAQSFPGAEGFTEDCMEMKSSRCSTVPAGSLVGWGWILGLVSLLRRRNSDKVVGTA